MDSEPKLVAANKASVCVCVLYGGGPGGFSVGGIATWRQIILYYTYWQAFHKEPF